VNESSGVARKLREQIHDFSGRLSPRFSLPMRRFVEEMLYGIQASQSVRLSEVGRSLEEAIPLGKTETRLSRNLAWEGLEEAVERGVSRLGARRVHGETLLIFDTSDVQKPYAKKMEYLETVRDGSTGELGEGYWLYTVAACERGKERVMPLYQALASAAAPDFSSDNDQILRAVDTVREAVGDRGVWVLDRGGDRGELFQAFLERSMRWIVRLRGDRHLFFRGKHRPARKAPVGCAFPYTETIVREDHGKEKVYTLSDGFRRVRLPRHSEDLFLVMVQGFGEEPLLLLTNLPMRRNREMLWAVVESYLTRWKVEEMIRFLKQSYHLEDIRVLTYRRLRNLVALVLAASFFAVVHLGERLQVAVLARRVLKAAKRIYGVPAFHCYALADGIAAILRRTGQGPLCQFLRRKPPPVTLQTALEGL